MSSASSKRSSRARCFALASSTLRAWSSQKPCVGIAPKLAPRAADFRLAVKRVVIRAVRFPLSARVIDRAAGLELRGFVVTGYPYVVVAAPMDTELVIYAVAHQSREPGYWKPRLASVRP
jgi:hypothetical protein